MRTWRRLFLAVVVVVAFGLIATGCGGDDEDEGSDATTDQPLISVSVPTELTVPEGENAEQAEKQIQQIYDDCIASLEQIPENAREEAREGCEALKE